MKLNSWLRTAGALALVSLFAQMGSLAFEAMPTVPPVTRPTARPTIPPVAVVITAAPSPTPVPEITAEVTAEVTLEPTLEIAAAPTPSRTHHARPSPTVPVTLTPSSSPAPTCSQPHWKPGRACPPGRGPATPPGRASVGFGVFYAAAIAVLFLAIRERRRQLRRVVSGV